MFCETCQAEVTHDPIPEDRSHCDGGNYCPCRYSDHDIQRYWDRVRRGYPDECWPWIGTLNPGGYGVITMSGNVQRIAHRLAYTLAGGVLEDGLTLDHLCRNRACVNPDHLEQVTSAENVRRGENWHRNKTHCPQGHEYTPENTSMPISPGQGRKCRTCALIRDRERNGYQGFTTRPIGPYLATCKHGLAESECRPCLWELNGPRNLDR